MTKVLNGEVVAGDVVAYTVRKHWDMATRIGVVVEAKPPAMGGPFDDKPLNVGWLLVRVVKSSNGHTPSQMVWLTELDRVVKLNGGSL